MAERPNLSWVRTRDGRMEVHDRGRRTRWQITPRHGGAMVGNHYGLSPPVRADSPSYPTPLAALNALEEHLTAPQENAR